MTWSFLLVRASERKYHARTLYDPLALWADRYASLLEDAKDGGLGDPELVPARLRTGRTGLVASDYALAQVLCDAGAHRHGDLRPDASGSVSGVPTGDAFCFSEPLPI